jgi:hypothetical protein
MFSYIKIKLIVIEIRENKDKKKIVEFILLILNRNNQLMIFHTLESKD